jgi:hypothetical protein
MKSRAWKALLLALLLPAWSGMPARAALADDGCIPVADIGPSIDRFLGEINAVQAAGQGALPFGDVLFGITGIDAHDQQAIADRPQVQMTRQQGTPGGDYQSRGPKRLTVEGVFAGRDTIFRVPKLVIGRYALSGDGVTLIYDPAHTIQVGESILGVKFFKTVNHTVITRTRLSYFFDTNDGDIPDRCYQVVQE